MGSQAEVGIARESLACRPPKQRLTQCVNAGQGWHPGPVCTELGGAIRLVGADPTVAADYYSKLTLPSLSSCPNNSARP